MAVAAAAAASDESEAHPRFPRRLGHRTGRAAVYSLLYSAVRRHGTAERSFGQPRQQSERHLHVAPLQSTVRQRPLFRCAGRNHAHRRDHDHHIAVDRLSARALDGAHALAHRARAAVDGCDRAAAHGHRGAHVRVDDVAVRPRRDQHHAAMARAFAAATDVQRVRCHRGPRAHLRALHGADASTARSKRRRAGSAPDGSGRLWR